MSAEAGLLADICEHPEDDTPRLVYADWLEEHDQLLRAEFIRVQCRLARLPEEDTERPALEARERELLAQRTPDWLGLDPDCVSGTPTFHRGFVEELAVGARQFQEKADRLFRTAPVRHLRLLRLSQTRGDLSALTAMPYLAKLRGLVLRNSQAGDERVAELLASPHWHGLETLDVSGCHLGARSAEQLVGPTFANLRALEIGSNLLGADDLRALFGAAHFRLESLDLSEDGVRAETVRVLGEAPGLRSLRHLVLANNSLNVPGGQALAEAEGLAHLESLHLGYTAIGVTGMRALCAAKHLAGLRVLCVQGTAGGRSGMQALAGSTFTGLRELNVAGSNLRDAGLEALATWPGLASVRDLVLDNNDLTGTGLAVLLGSRHLGRLRSLSLSYNRLGEAGLGLLAVSERLAGLERLALHGISFPGSSVDAFLSSATLAGLRELAIDAGKGTAYRKLEARFRVP